MCAYMSRGTGGVGDLGVGRLTITNTTPKGFSLQRQQQQSQVKVGPVVPPKPKSQVPNKDFPPPPPYPSSGVVSGGYEEDLPPPPPPDHLYIDPVECGGDSGTGPASPVSSSYSELRRATTAHVPPPPSMVHTTQHVPSVVGGSVVPRSDKQRALVAQYNMDNTSTNQKSSGAGDQPISAREAEIDSLTRSLKLQLDHPDEDIYGLCAKCGGSVTGEGGCTALDRVYHMKCFTCVVCSVVLQNQPFYMIDEKAHCHRCYLCTLEKCSVCSQPITERILRATGKPYHPHCFKCVECGVSLDGVCFTVDAANRVHCIDDFHKKFAPKCSVCHLPIMPESGQQETVRVVAMDRSFHVDCYKCEDCGMVLSSEAEGRGCFPLDGHVLCKSCNAARVRKMTSGI